MKTALFRWPWWRPLNTPITDWRGKRVWLLGASSGIGAALAQELLARGAKVALSARNAQALQELAARWPQQALALPFDVAGGDWVAAREELAKTFGGLDLVVFNAAQYAPERSWELDAGRAAHTLQVNLTSVYQGLSAILPLLLAQGQGGVALVASVAGYVGLPQASVYGPGKAALINLAEILYNDLHRRGLDVYLINPGFVKTALTDKNDFPMPCLQTPQQAALAILQGFAHGAFEIHFPRRFSTVVKCLRLLPWRWRFALFARLMKV
ncbi:SDR family NAD(P)-dependent oxidoreductase [Massilia sp. W12]|uniref:SDR family NAD(P)-dependent oxidoreductase n=1 Tax=Massilia sp. W12 TaxID=3126507 RepID=UPI0030D24792